MNDGHKKPPLQLSSIPHLRWLSPTAYPSGIYFLVKLDRVVYVGQTVNLAARIGEHRKDKDFDDVFYIPCPKADLNDVEGAFIRYLNPPLNGCTPARRTDDREILAAYGVRNSAIRATR